MLRLLVLALLLANGLYFGWAHGYLAPLGFAPIQQSEHQRLDQQVRPEAVHVLATDEVRRIEAAAASAARPPDCLQAGLFDDAQAGQLKPVLDNLPPGSWTLEPGVEPARWIIYMGKYLTQENVARKKAELRQLGVSFEVVTNPALDPGLSLGVFTSQAAANDQLARLARSGVRTARVVQERPELRGQLLRLPVVDDALRPRLDDLKPVLGGRALRTCR